MYMFIKMGSGWFCKEVQSIISAVNCGKALEHIRNGEVVAFADDIEYFADQIGINADDIEMVK